MKANEKQIGGRHYKTSYEHWDLAIVIPMTYLEGCATKYIARSRKKGGVEDLKKAMHYIEKIMETTNYETSRRLTRPAIHNEVNKFALVNHLSLAEEELVVSLCLYESALDLQHAQYLLEELIAEAEFANRREDKNKVIGPGTPEDGGHHSKDEPL